MNAAANGPDFLWFQRAGKTFAVPMECLQGVLSDPGLRPLPVAEPALAGLMILREMVLPVFDPALFVGLQIPPRLASPIVVLLRLENQPCLGLLAEKVGKVIELPAPAPLSTQVRLPVAFIGETKSKASSRSLVLNIPALARAMGLMGSPLAPKKSAREPLKVIATRI
jgi:chemotaxis signal transduction protein